ncbi:hypothetical protein GOO57_000330 [Salmonella enterica]|nr:hypothetical protein [Salmonella enterica]EDD2425721.1 hypothetical protein [Salmonella enterica]EDJ5710776.1 hypothetical protein [Salmonella enterica]EDZ6858967.1 hypothetical protein [Salmonella enterica]EJM8229660.1 hypothetical protein [Salmonella enterica]
MSITSERERVVAPPIQSCDDDNTPDTTVFRSVPQHWTLTPQQPCAERFSVLIKHSWCRLC